jgi:hypothetical protein
MEDQKMAVITYFVTIRQKKNRDCFLQFWELNIGPGAC